MTSERNVPYREGLSLLETPDHVPENSPPLHQTRPGYFEPDDRNALLAFHPEVVLYCPQIPQNTGTIARLCAAFSCTLHLIEPMAFHITEKAVKRAGLDYWKHVNIFVHKNFEDFLVTRPNRRLIFIETGAAEATPFTFRFLPGDVLIFGAETFGIPMSLLQHPHIQQRSHRLTIPMFNTGVRSLNLANTVSILLYQAVASVHPETSYSTSSTSNNPTLPSL